jgi:hypothetical protein
LFIFRLNRDESKLAALLNTSGFLTSQRSGAFDSQRRN